ncbi:MAG: PilZ domain-containing protein [Phycisphaerae bacterium]|nr:PilZ domain-containing protein [Phycisphaerae bacterium]
MDRMRYVEPSRQDEILAEAIEKTTPVVVTTSKGTAWVTHKSHFLAAPGLEHRLLLHAPLTAESGSTTAVLRGEQIGISFRRGHKKCMFGTVVEDLQEYPQAIVLAWPEQMQEFQRRVYYRSAPPRGTTVDVRYWVAEEAVRSSATQPPENAYHGTLQDLSVGGIRIETNEHPVLSIGQTVVCHFSYKRGAPPLTIHATVRHLQDEARGGESLGLQFVGLETTPGGRKRLVRLAQIVSELQRSNYGSTPHRRHHRYAHMR